MINVVGLRNVLWINPVGTSVFDEPIRAYLERYKDDATSLDVVSLPEGPSDLNYLQGEARVISLVLDVIDRSTSDAVVVGCFNDTGVHAAREGRDRLVIGPGESAHHLASQLGSRWTVLVSDRKCIPRMEQVAKRYGFCRSRVTFRAVGIGVHEFQVDREKTVGQLIDVAREAIRVDLAETIVLGCTIQFDLYEEMQRVLGVPVIDVAVAALKQAEFAIDLSRRTGWRHSTALTYAGPERRIT